MRKLLFVGYALWYLGMQGGHPTGQVYNDNNACTAVASQLNPLQPPLPNPNWRHYFCVPTV